LSELKRITIKEMIPSTAVNAILPVTLAEPGINPIIFIKIKKKIVSRKGQVLHVAASQVRVLPLHHAQSDDRFDQALGSFGR
jgi:hypothetical protein